MVENWAAPQHIAAKFGFSVIPDLSFEDPTPVNAKPTASGAVWRSFVKVKGYCIVSVIGCVVVLLVVCEGKRIYCLVSVISCGCVELLVAGRF